MLFMFDFFAFLLKFNSYIFLIGMIGMIGSWLFGFDVFYAWQALAFQILFNTFLVFFVLSNFFTAPSGSVYSLFQLDSSSFDNYVYQQLLIFKWKLVFGIDILETGFKNVNKKYNYYINFFASKIF